MSDELAIREAAEIVHQSSPLEVGEVLAVVRRVQSILQEVMQEGVHYGKVPGCGDKPCLLKPGAEKLSMTFRLLPRYDVRLTDLGGGHREYSVTCTLEGPDGGFRGQGVGSCSTLEKKYRYRKSGSDRVENPDLADIYNTVLKMAKKRAHVDAVITATSCGDIFTQDIEDNPEAFARDSRPVNQPQAQQSQPAAATNGNKISDAQRKRFYAIAKTSGFADEVIKAKCLEYGFEHSADITRDVYDELCGWAAGAVRR